ncbi:LysR family transcriptional regulator [Aquisediminimonas profunda]|uniref:LysR family transcriptional regulator n=1 Tax=Aquisediminimonas profunda TaxID=1550733 RepID=UPI001C62FB3A|nr:LysR family transcriptional regulator [Aquisediminimonas profunda]
MRFDRLDLNLLVALDTLIERGNVSLAAEDLCLSQSAMSGALKRLREYFGDELLIPNGRAMVLTPKAKQLAHPVREALLYVRYHITTPGKFNPSTSDRCFQIVGTDYSHQLILANVISQIAKEAPDISFAIHAPDSQMVELFNRGEIDLFISAQHPMLNIGKEHKKIDLFTDEEVVICWDENPLCDSDLNTESFSALGHAVTNFGPNRHPAISEMVFEQLNIERRIEVTVSSFSSLPLAIIGTQRIATMHRRQAEYFARLQPIKILALPFPMPPVQLVAHWHIIRAADDGLSWLLAHIMSAVEKLDEQRAMP